MTHPESILENVVDDFLGRSRAGEKPTIDEYLQQYPSLAEDISDVLSSIELMEQFSHCELEYREQISAQRASTPPISRLGEFDVVREIGRGGMGVVYEAIDRTLQRRVALKVLNDTALTMQKHIDRFRRESRLAAQLHHTNIVSVFGVGEENQKRFYAMQYVEGVSLQEVIDGLRQISLTHVDAGLNGQVGSDAVRVATAFRNGDFAEPGKTNVNVQPVSSASYSTLAPDSMRGERKGTSPSDESNEPTYGIDAAPRVFDRPETVDVTRGTIDAPRFKQSYWRSVARIGVQVADALDYAHRTGILHRDIKPANLLFDAQGTVWVADFGLAKLTETNDLTKTGDVVGTLRYMAPEQLEGRADERTDIHALGQILYELLTLRPVFDGKTYKDLLATKQEPAHASPRKNNPAIPRDLETIVQKTLELDPNQRYHSAGDLSDDLQRFLDDRPILARRVTIAERTWRWCRRNRALTALAAMVLAMLLFLPIVLGWAYVREARQKQTTEKTLNVALAGFDELFAAYLENDLAAAATLTETTDVDAVSLAPAMLTKDTARLLERMLVVYDRLAEENATSNNVSLAVESAKARRRVGDLYQQLGQFAKAANAYDDAADRYRLLANRETTHRIEIARIYQALGLIQEQQQEMGLARAEYERALRLLEQMTPNDATRYELARTEYLLGKRPAIEGITPRRAMGRGERLGRGPRDGPVGRPHPPRVGLPPEYGFVEMMPDDAVAERQTLLKSAVSRLDELRSGDPDAAAYRFLLALCLRESAGQGARAPSLVEGQPTAISLLQDLVAQFPAVPRYRFELCRTYRALSRSTLVEDEGQSIEYLLLARELAEQLVDEQQTVASYRINLAHIYADLGIEYSERRDMKHAEEFTRLSIATHESVINEFPGLAALSNRLSMNDRNRLGSWLLRMRRYDEVVELLEPMGEQLFGQISSHSEVESGDSLRQQRSALIECADLLLPAYEAMHDEVGYFVVLTWLDVARSMP